MNIESLAKQVNMPEYIVEQFVRGVDCVIRELYEGDLEQAVKDIKESPEIVGAAVMKYVNDVRSMTTTVLTREKEFCRIIYDMLVMEEV